MDRKRQIPSLRALRAFESAARLNSFVHAAAELNVTPGAISQQIQTLEAVLGTKLFLRSGRGVRLTGVGEEWVAEVQRCLYTLEATIDLARKKAATVLTITVAPSVASRWLMRRLYRFNERHPGINLRVVATPEVLDLRDHDIDVAIRFGPGTYKGLAVEKMLDEHLIPMCAPGLEGGSRSLSEPDDLRNHTLIHDDSISIEGGAWPLWLKAVGGTKVDSARGPRYSLADLALQAAIDGQGVVLARWQLAREDVRAGRLVCPFNCAVQSPFHYFLVTRWELKDAPKVSNLWEWLIEECRDVTGPPFDIAVG